MYLVLDLLIAALAIVGALGFLVSALALLRVRDALSMVNSLGPATGVGVPLLLAAALLHQGRTEGWDIVSLVEVVLAETDFDGVTLQTICIEHEDPDLVMKTVRQLALEDLPNINYIQAMKKTVGMA